MLPIKKFIHVLNFKEKKSVIFLLVLILIGMLVETLGVGLVIPIFTIITDPDVVNKYPSATAFISNLSPLHWFSNQEKTITTHTSLINGALFVILLFYSLKACFLVFLTWRQTTFVTKLAADWSNKLFNGYLNLPYSFFLQKNSAFLIRNVDHMVIFAGTLELTLVLITEILVVIGIAALLFITEPLGALAVIIIFLVSSYYFQYFTKRHLTNWAPKRHLYDGEKIKNIKQGFDAIKDLKLLGREQNFADEYLKYNRASLFLNRNIKVLKSLPRIWLEMMVIISLSSLLFVMQMGEQPINKIITTLGLFAAASFRLMPSANKILGNISDLRYSIPIVDNAYNELTQTISKKMDKNNNGILNFKKSINLDQVDHTYEGTSQITLDKISITIPYGSLAGFIGESGSGKTTLIDIILGLLNPTHGHVKIDEVDIQTDLRGWQNQIGYVPQDIYLTDDTLRKNVAFAIAEDKISDELVDEAIKGANLDKFVKSLPKGLMTMVGEKGVRLSGGQRQRIGIARALYHKPKVLVLDEATSALDIETEKEIMGGIVKLKKNKTVLIITHRLSAVSKCDILFKLDKGKIIQKGTYNEIIGNAQ